MNRLKQIATQLKRFWAFRRSRPLPQTEQALEALIEETLDLGGFPLNDSFRHSMATQIMHMNSESTSCTAKSFVQTLRRSIANQVAFNVIQDTKGRQASEKTISSSAS